MTMKLAELARFLPILEQSGFKAGEWSGLREAEPGVFVMPYVDYGDIASDFVDAAYKHGWVLTGFDWVMWKDTEAAQALWTDAATVAGASPRELAQMLTVVIRQDRFVEGALLGAFESGLMLRIVRRASELLEVKKAPSGRR
jgi:hypothetical protein